jgi:hypothetical protein
MVAKMKGNSLSNQEENQRWWKCQQVTWFKESLKRINLKIAKEKAVEVSSILHRLFLEDLQLMITLTA